MYRTNSQEIRRFARNAGQCIAAAVLVTLAVFALLALDNAKASSAPDTEIPGYVDPTAYYVTPATGGGLSPRGVFVAEDAAEWDCRIDGDQICGPDFVVVTDAGTFIIGTGYYGR